MSQVSFPIDESNYGQYSDGAIQAHYINDDGVTSTVVRLGPMIAPYVIHELRIDGYEVDGDNTEYTISGVAQIGSEITITNGIDPPEDTTTTTDAWGHFTIILSVVNDNSGTDLTGFTITMTDPTDNTFGSVPVSIEQNRPVGSFSVDAANGYAVELNDIIPATADESNQYTEDGGLTWETLTEASVDAPISNGLYSAGSIRVRSEGGVSTVKSGIISPYQPRDIRIQRSVDSDWLVSGTADIGSTITLVDSTDPSNTPIGASVTANEYGEFELIVDASTIDPDTVSYRLQMTNNGLTGYQDIPSDLWSDGPVLPASPNASYELDGDQVSVLVYDYPESAVVQVSFDGGRTWS